MKKHPDDQSQDEKHRSDDGFALELGQPQDQFIAFVARKMFGLHEFLLLFTIYFDEGSEPSVVVSSTSLAGKRGYPLYI